MARTIEQAAEYVAREFLGWVAVGQKLADWKDERDEAAPWRPTPGPTPDFFFALWGETKRRRWYACVEDRPVLAHASVELISEDSFRLDAVREGARRSSVQRFGDPREALIRCVEHWLDASEGEV